MKEIKPPAGMEPEAIAPHANMIARRIAVKEQHAESCKRELLILWTDFFKPEHLEKHPELHNIFWKAAKLCSQNKQEVNEEAARELAAAVDEIAKIFYEVKGVPERYEAYQRITEKLF
jgi:nickel superoxide dismutase